jgi:hypothetical protein
MIDFPLIKRWFIGLVTTSFFVLGSWASPAIAQTNVPQLAKELINLPQIPLNQFPAIPCTTQLQTQFNQQAKIPFSCNLGELIPAEKVFAIGNFANFGLTQTSLWQLANANNINLSTIGADQLQSFYSLITPNKLLGDRFGGIYQGQTLSELPLIKEAFIQNITNKIQAGDLSQIEPLNNLLREHGIYGRGLTTLIPSDFSNAEQLRQKLANLPLGKLVSNIPAFGDFSLANLPTSVFQSFNVTEAIPNLLNQSIGSIPGVESLMVGDLDAVGLPNLSLSQMPNPLSLVGGVRFGQFDLPLSSDEQNPNRQLAGGIPEGDYQLRKQNCSDKCKFVEITSPDPTYHGAAWVDGNEHWVPDGFGLVCWAWPGGCKGPAGNHPFGRNLRLLLTNIDASAGTAQVAFTFPICWDAWFVGTTCTPAIFPIASGIPLYTIHEGDWLPFVAPINYGDRNASLSPPNSPDRPIPKSIA